MSSLHMGLKIKKSIQIFKKSVIKNKLLILKFLKVKNKKLF